MEQLRTMPVRGKWMLLFAGCFLVFFLAYRFNIRKAITAVSAYRQLNRSAAQWNDSAGNDIRPAASASSPAQDDSSVLNCVSRYADESGLAVQELSQRYDNSSDTGAIETNKIVLEGSYVQLLQMVYYVEQRKLNAAVCSAGWELKSSSAGGTPVLLLTMYIKKLKNE